VRSVGAPPPLPRAAPNVTPEVRPATAGTAAARGRLIVIAKDGGEGPAYPLHDQVDIGRVEGNIVIADDRYLSPRHARLTRKGASLSLRDLGSVNGVYLRLAPPPTNGSKPAESEVPLGDQDLFLVGQQVIRFEVVRDAEEGLGPAVEHGTLLFGTPTSPRFARLCQRTIEGVTRDVYYVSKRETVLGREGGDIVFTEDPFLSRRHAIVRADGLPAAGKRATAEPRFALVDLGSSNGTFIQIRTEVTLHDGDQFRIGQQLFRVDLTHDPGTA
jgi:pSer/pThr/pTyr-binding forkhead associated (FHA) protein